MKEFIENLQCMWTYRKRRFDIERAYYNYHRYLVMFDIKDFFGRIKFWKKKSEIPF